ncbi:MAG: tRNA (adenosine(37)-N6)-dimethylallyltransferase MiaA [Ahrensia sp.]
MAPLKRPIHLIAGPTASGKSARALDIAAREQAAIINTDSMQVYDVLRIITARPSNTDLSAAPHYLYGHMAPSAPYSTGIWMRQCADLLRQLPDEQPLIFVGGTGLYFKALLGGLSPIPAIPDTIRTRWREALTLEGAAALHRILQERDPALAKTLKPGDGQRIARALEVIDATGKSLAWWQTQPGEALIDENATQKTIILPERPLLHERINTRFIKMANEGALDEVRALNALDINPALPAKKAIGVPEFSAYLAGELSLEAAIERGQAATRQYAKRQMTWLRNQFGPDWSVTTGSKS